MENNVHSFNGQQPAMPDPSTLTQAAMMRMARSLHADGHVHEAMETYCQLIERYPDTEAARVAMLGLVDLAQYCEEQGMPHIALQIYGKLEELR